MWRTFIITLLITLGISSTAFSSGSTNSSPSIVLSLEKTIQERQRFIDKIKLTTQEMLDANSRQEKINILKGFHEELMTFFKYRRAVAKEIDLDPKDPDTFDPKKNINTRTADEVKDFKSILSSFESIYNNFQYSVVVPYALDPKIQAQRRADKDYVLDVCDNFISQTYFNYGVRDPSLSLESPEKTMEGWCKDLVDTI